MLKKLKTNFKKLNIETFLIALILIIVPTYYLISGLTLTKFPVANVDEGWQWNNALLFSDKNFSSVNLHFFGHGEGLPFVLDFLLGIIGNFAGVGLFQGRLLILIISFATLILLFSLTKKLYDAKTALLAVIFLILTDTFLSGSRLIRTDLIMGAFLLIWALFFFSFAKTNKLLPLILASATLSFGFEVHQNNALFYLGSLFTLTILPTKTLQKKIYLLALYILGPLIYGVYYLTAHILPNVSSFAALYRYGIFIDHPLPIFSMSPVQMVVAEINRYTNYFFGGRFFEFSIILPGFLLVLFNKKYKQSFLGLFVFFSALMFLLFSASKLDHYFVTFYLIFAIFAAKFLSLVLFGTWPKLKNLQQNFKNSDFNISFQLKTTKKFRETAYLILVATIILLTGLNIFRIAIRFKNFSEYNLQSLGKKIETSIPKESKIMGPPYWFMVLPEHRFVSFYTLTWYRVLEGKQLLTAFEEIASEYLIVDKTVRDNFVNDKKLLKNTNFQEGLYYIYKPEIETMLQNYGKRIVSFDDEFLGPVEIYKLNFK